MYLHESSDKFSVRFYLTILVVNNMLKNIFDLNACRCEMCGGPSGGDAPAPAPAEEEEEEEESPDPDEQSEDTEPSADEDEDEDVRYTLLADFCSHN